jgi:hypothetical protein
MGKVLWESTILTEDFKNPNWRARTGEPTVWIQMDGTTLLLNGQPSSGYVLVGYVQEPAAMVADVDVPDPRIKEYLHQYLKFAAASWLLKQSGQGQNLKKSSEYYATFVAGIGLGPMGQASKMFKG